MQKKTFVILECSNNPKLWLSQDGKELVSIILSHSCEECNSPVEIEVTLNDMDKLNELIWKTKEELKFLKYAKPITED